MKRMMILGTALSLALLGLLRASLLAQEPAQRASGTDNFREMPQDGKLTDAQRAFRDWDAKTFGVPDPLQWQKLPAQERAAVEEKYLKQLSSEEEHERVEAINALVGLQSKKAIAGILRIAAERKEKNNRDRHTACRALGMLGDPTAIPELAHLTYHYNWNTRQWAQISLVRLTGQNFSRDVAAWARWWKEQGYRPPISEEPVSWATSPMTISHADPAKQEEMDRQAAERLLQQRRSQQSRDGRPNDRQPAMGNSPDVSKQRAKARERMLRDRELFSPQELSEMESLMRIANQNFGSQAAWDAMTKLVAKYKKANRTGCALLYLGQMNKDGQKRVYLQQAIDKHGDCCYGDGVQVGAFARLLLGREYWEGGESSEAKRLFAEIRRHYPDAIDHNGKLLVEQLPK